MPKVLIVDDDAAVRRSMVRYLNAFGIETIEAQTLNEGYLAFGTYSESLDMIIIDGCVDNPNHLDSLPLIATIRGLYSKPILASSGNEDNLPQMLNAGASHSALKAEAASMVLKILNIKP
jgi:DNA-binding response OmpR family regulator